MSLVLAALVTLVSTTVFAMTVASSTFIRKGPVAWRLVLPMLAFAVLASPIGVQVALGLGRTVLPVALQT